MKRRESEENRVKVKTHARLAVIFPNPLINEAAEINNNLFRNKLVQKVRGFCLPNLFSFPTNYIARKILSRSLRSL